MAMLMFTCPVTHRPVSTGVEAEPSNVEFLLDVARTVACPRCGGYHVWHKREAWLADSRSAGSNRERLSACVSRIPSIRRPKLHASPASTHARTGEGT
jgi:hypothetical protein